jgi:transcriptional regulator with XRE-family HTH domain
VRGSGACNPGAGASRGSSGERRTSDNLTTLRRQRGYTQTALADAVGIHVTQLRRYEAGTGQPTVDVARRLAATLATSIDSLANDENPRLPPPPRAFNQLATTARDVGAAHPPRARSSGRSSPQ